MYVNDPIGDMLTRIRNGQHARKSKVVTPCSKERIKVLEVLKAEGYIRHFSVENVRKGIDNIIVELKYAEGEPVIQMIQRVSTPGLRVYSSVNDLGTVNTGLGIQILSTSRGVMSDVEARAQGIGGEVICKVF
jgi:small subunit ribosomal protein S8